MRAFIVLPALLLLACPSTPLCGAGTSVEADTCVPDLAVLCGASTVEAGGVCVTQACAGLSCGAGTSRQADVCVATPVDAGKAECLAVDAGVMSSPDIDAGVCLAGAHGVPYCSSTFDCASLQSCKTPATA